MIAQFSSSESASIEKEIEKPTELIETCSEHLDFVYEIPRSVEWIKKHDFRRVCLQFPDYLLNDSSEVALRLQDDVNQVVYIMGDTAYGSCCIDYITAAHIEADAVIHYGPVCFSKATNTIPCLFIYEKHTLDVTTFRDTVNCRFSDVDDITIIVDTPYIIHLDKIKGAFNRVTVCDITENDLNLTSKTVIFVGNSIRKMTNLNLSCKPKELFYYDPSAVPAIINYKQNLKILKRRYFLIETIKDSRTIGIVIGTVAVKNYLKVIERIKRLIMIHKKKYYVISVGKPTVAKLANFSEIDVFVIITCAMNEIYDSHDFYKPIVTPYDIEAALNPKATELQFSYDYNDYLPGEDLSDDLEQLDRLQQNDVSLLTGRVRNHDNFENNCDDNRLALKQDGTVSTNCVGAGFLAERSWKGLEQNLGYNEPELASEGRHGLAGRYTHENECKD